MIASSTMDAPFTLAELDSQLAEPLPARELMGDCGGCGGGVTVSVAVCISLGAKVHIG